MTVKSIKALFGKSDQHAYNWIYDKDGNSFP